MALERCSRVIERHPRTISYGVLRSTFYRSRLISRGGVSVGGFRAEIPWKIKSGSQLADWRLGAVVEAGDSMGSRKVLRFFVAAVSGCMCFICCMCCCWKSAAVFRPFKMFLVPAFMWLPNVWTFLHI